MEKAIFFAVLEQTQVQAHPPLGIIEIDVGTIFFTLFNTAVIALLYYFFLHKKVTDILDKRTVQINAQITEAEESNEKAKQSEREYADKLKQSETAAAEILAKANLRGAEERQILVEAAKLEAARVKENAAAELKRDTERANEELKAKFADLVLDAANAVVTKEIKQQDNELIIDEFLQKIR